MNNFANILDLAGVKPESSLLIAVSGGPDSMCMLHLIQSMQFKALCVAHVNYGLRGVESDADEKLVRDYCKIHDLKFHSKKINFSKEINQGESVQMLARKIRYDWFKELMKEHGIEFILIGSNKDDQAETILINLIRGTSYRGMRGMKSVKKNIIRPLLGVERNIIMDYMLSLNVPFRLDQSNFKNDYTRNKIRNQIVPILKEINPSIIETFNRNAERFLHLENILHQSAAEFRLANIERNLNTDEIQIPAKYDQVFVANLMLILEGDYGFNFQTCKDISYDLFDRTGKMFYSHSHTAELSRGKIYLSKNSVQGNKPKQEGVEIVGLTGQVSFPLMLKWHIQETQKDLFKDSDCTPRVAMLDLKTVDFPLQLRKWEKGDKFQPLGMKGQKKLSDYFTDIKLSRTEKANTFVLVSNDKIVWLVGHRISECCKITNNTKTALRIEQY